LRGGDIYRGGQEAEEQGHGILTGDGRQRTEKWEEDRRPGTENRILESREQAAVIKFRFLSKSGKWQNNEEQLKR
jgi:hypothetical protein